MADAKTPRSKSGAKKPSGPKATKAVAAGTRDAASSATAKDTARRTKKMPAPPSYEDVADLAYQKFEQHGYQHGRDVDDWVEAERELMATQAGGGKPSKPKR